MLPILDDFWALIFSITAFESKSRAPNLLYRVVQLSLTAEIEVFYMLFERPLSIFYMTSLKQHI